MEMERMMRIIIMMNMGSSMGIRVRLCSTMKCSTMSMVDSLPVLTIEASSSNSNFTIMACPENITSSSSSSSIIHTICRHVDSKKDILTMQDSSHTNRPGVKTALMVVKKCQVKRARYCHPLAFVPTKVEKVNLAITACMEWTALIAIMEFGAVELEESAVEEQGTPILRRHGG